MRGDGRLELNGEQRLSRRAQQLRSLHHRFHHALVLWHRQHMLLEGQFTGDYGHKHSSSLTAELSAVAAHGTACGTRHVTEAEAGKHLSGPERFNST